MRIQDLIARGTRAAQPAATTVSEGALYYVTDESVIERSNGATWDAYSGAGGGGVTFTAASKLLGRGSAGGAGAAEEITLGTGLTMTGTTLAAAGGGGGGLVLLASQTAAASASLDFTTAITSTYDVYHIDVDGLIPTTDLAQLWLRLSTNGGASYDAGTNYALDAFAWRTGVNPVVIGGGTGLTKLDLTASLGQKNTASEGLTATLKIFAPLSASRVTQIHGDAAGRDTTGHYGVRWVGHYLPTTAVNALQFLCASGTIASGSIRIYGVVK